LAPIIVTQLQEILGTLKQQGLTMLLVEQNFHFATKLADQAIILEQSQIQWQGDCQTLLGQQKIQMEWLGI
ncbi:MAG: ABC transporter, partial [Alphaproteobacteria bacterium]|nr:ABC transporter [Alphaproteobacteria bacterium]